MHLEQPKYVHLLRPGGKKQATPQQSSASKEAKGPEPETPKIKPFVR